MTRVLATALTVVLAGCSSTEERQQQALMDMIEARVQLPEKAWPLKEYARYYADAGDGTIHGVYLIPTEEPDANDVCELLAADGSSRVVPCPQMRPDWEVPADERRWFEDHRELPYINDGGCSEVDVVFDRTKSAVLSVTCNGEA
jgi:hypothetical protein